MGFKRKIFIAFVAVLAGAEVIVAEPSQARVDALRSAIRKLDDRAPAAESERRRVIELHRGKVEQLIRDLEAGRDVDPLVIDRIIEEAERICR